ncbi:MoxR family ATPase [Demequina sp. NBRC 110053]|uniref:AAA family ATPase n=1 Tax=Demequina sp. NBRC 110053 TaxID=1570342 RepID=UPI000A04C6FA|nr:MoxR family ATPase [Demequina sp. NBRC 110053]
MTETPDSTGTPPPADAPGDQATPASGPAGASAASAPPAPTEAAPSPPAAQASSQPAEQPGDDAAPARRSLAALRTEVGKAVVGQDAIVTGLVIALLCRGHVLLEGVPGVAKTLLVRTLSHTVSLDFKRVQFTPDLMPGDVTGSLVYDARTAAFSFRAGPVFTNLLLADEINRTPPKTQSSLLEAMEERQVTVDGEARALPEPFMVIATQNPVEYEGTYPLPEAQLDRFLMKLPVPLPERAAEVDVVLRHAAGFTARDLEAAGVRAAASVADLDAGREAVARVSVSREVAQYVVDLCRATREAPSVSLGVSPRGATALLSTSRAWAWMRGGTFVTPDDVKALAEWTLGHRIQMRAEAELEGVTSAAVLQSVLASVPVPR